MLVGMSIWTLFAMHHAYLTVLIAASYASGWEQPWSNGLMKRCLPPIAQSWGFWKSGTAAMARWTVESAFLAGALCWSSAWRSWIESFRWRRCCTSQAVDRQLFITAHLIIC